MKKAIWIGTMTTLLATVMPMNAGASSYSTGAIPDGSPVGVSFTGNYDEAAAGATLGSLTVSLSISGGFNGNLYAYLVAPNGTWVLLLDQPGATVGNSFGYNGSGLNVTLSDTAAGSLQTTPETPGAVFTGTYQAAGSLSGFNGSVANGNWTLFVADEVSGGGQAQLSGWSLDIMAVPEPANMALLILGLGLMGVIAMRRYGGSAKATPQGQNLSPAAKPRRHTT